MKKVLLFCAVVLMAVGCTKDNKLKINGSVSDKSWDGAKVLLFDEMMIPFDSTVVKDAQFAFEGNCDTPKIVTICIQIAEDNIIKNEFVYENGLIDLTCDASTYHIELSGTPNNVVYAEFLSKYKGLHAEYEQAMKVSQKDAEKVEEKFVDLGYEYSKKYPKTIVGEIAFLSSYWGMSLEQRKEITQMISEEFKKDPKVATIISNIEQESNSSVGKNFIDFSAPDVDGNTVVLSSLVGQTDYLLIDFWASWCGPCIKSLPDMKDLYKKHHGKRFDIIGFSLDDKKENWVAAINKYELPWTNISELKKWNSQPAKLYAISFIPSTILIDRNGKIVGRNLHAEEIDELLSKK